MIDRTTLRIPPSVLCKWKRLAEAEGRSLSNWVVHTVNTAIEDFVYQPESDVDPAEPTEQTVYVNGLSITIKADR